MSQRKKKKIQRAVQKEPGSETTGRDQNSKRTIFVIASVVVAIILIIVGVFYYQSYVAPFQRPVITVDNTAIRMGYFLKRTKIAGSDPVTVLQQLAYEQIVEQEAPNFVVEPTPSDINDELLYIASTESVTSTENVTRYLTESEFKKWYQEQLKQTGLSDAEYKEITRINLLASSLQQYLASKIPTIAEQVHLSIILVANSSDATKAKARISAGESFAAVAREVSLDTQSKDSGGDIGWVPRGVYPSHDQTIFGLGTGGVSDPVAVDPTTPDTSQYFLFMVSEKATGREIDDSSMQALKSNALINWLAQEMPSHNITINYDFNNSENQAWINWQLAK